LTIELAILVAYGVGYEATIGGTAHDATQTILLAMTAAALGLQSSAIQRFGVSGLSTTYLTGTLTTAVIRLASGRPLRDVAHHHQLLAGLVVGAVAGGFVALHAARGVPVLQVGCVLLVLLGVGCARREKTPVTAV
jgi:uncharacterized membrane protein YoaK (UPF0700 family)